MALATTHYVIPSAILLEDVRLEKVHDITVGGGAFADIYYGLMDGQAVAVKQLRTYMHISKSDERAQQHLQVKLLSAYRYD